MKNTQIINEIIEIESKAQELIQNARREQAELPLKISKILEEKKNIYHEKALAKIEEIRLSEEEAAKDKIRQIIKAHEEKLDKLKTVVDENIDAWVDKVYNFIINPADI